MLFKIVILTSFIFSVLYPLCFWISYKDPLKNKFHRFHIGLPNFIAGITVIVLLFSPIPVHLKILVVIWKVSLLSISSYSWQKIYPNPYLITIPSVIGGYVFLKLQEFFIGQGFNYAFVAILAGLILASALFAMNLGHWYLNVHGLPLSHLRRATYVFWALLAFRALYDLIILVTGKVFYLGEYLSLFSFCAKLDGIFLLIALFFGTLFPLISLFFAKGTLDLKNTQATTGILYVVLCSVVLGDIAYKYYLIKFGIAL